MPRCKKQKGDRPVWTRSFDGRALAWLSKRLRCRQTGIPSRFGPFWWGAVLQTADRSGKVTVESLVQLFKVHPTILADARRRLRRTRPRVVERKSCRW